MRCKSCFQTCPGSHTNKNLVVFLLYVQILCVSNIGNRETLTFANLPYEMWAGCCQNGTMRQTVVDFAWGRGPCYLLAFSLADILLLELFYHSFSVCKAAHPNLWEWNRSIYCLQNAPPVSSPAEMLPAVSPTRPWHSWNLHLQVNLIHLTKSPNLQALMQHPAPFKWAILVKSSPIQTASFSPVTHIHKPLQAGTSKRTSVCHCTYDFIATKRSCHHCLHSILPKLLL